MIRLSFELDRMLISEETLRSRVKELASQISADYTNKKLVAVAILKGAVVFLVDLMRYLDPSVELHIDFMAVSSYGASTQSSGILKITKDLDVDVKGENVLLVEDIVDTGLTLSYLVRLLQEREPLSLKVCVLLDKPDRREAEVQVDYRGFSIPNEFVVGYGLDCAGMWRNLSSIYVVKERG
ncbi:MAG TPA: hypoxanthine phosphoribosyltransferase [Thermosynergistes sp.]|nr:hypoxanthine phosphoribosyltransferase [Thermosynergistes sp.]HXK88813.1 hypoxanthine phosphoribosyltransferase [Thermosynergistes sp.]